MLSSQDGHSHSDTSRHIVVPPVAHDGLSVSVELKTVLSVKVGRADEGVLGAGEAEERRRHRDREIYSDLANVGVKLNPEAT